MHDTRDPLLMLRTAAAARAAMGLRRELRPRAPGPDDMVDLASNDYLGLARNPLVAEAAAAAALQWGTGSTGSRLVTGSTELHARLERALAGFCAAPAALVFSSGYLANLATVTALVSALAAGSSSISGGFVVSDAANHASLIDACRLSRARVQVAPHLDVAAVAAALAGRTEPAALVVTEAVFSVDGDLAPLVDLHQVARAYGAILVVDEAHSLGVLGPDGRGAVCAAGLAGEPDVVRTVTLSKSLAAQGGAVLGSDEVIQALIDIGRSFIFDTGLAPPCAGAALAALEMIQAEPDLGGRTRENAMAIAELAGGLGLPASRPAAGVISVILGSPEEAVRAQRTCAEHGVRAGCFRPPSVPAGSSCLRLAARATLTERDFAAISLALTAVRQNIRVGASAGRRSL
ncbi:MAG TPA: 8-amino-7-oxononanoate synthase [Streptosporangiaceae bacterium]|nr:8-amino-7-oxononanoate synthase [Streptosporangiaceae bacterium]